MPPYRTTPGLFEFFIIEFGTGKAAYPGESERQAEAPHWPPAPCPDHSGPAATRQEVSPRLTLFTTLQPVFLLGTNNSTRRTLWAPHLSSVVWTMVAGAPEQEGTQRRSVGGPPRQPGQRDLTGASMVEETVAEWPVPTSDENLNQPPLGLAVLTVCNQWRCGGDYPGMLRHTDSKEHSEKW